MSRSLLGAVSVRTFVEHEHRELVGGIDRLHDVARDVGDVAAPGLLVELDEIAAWVDGVLGPHAAWEESWLYPELDQRAGTPWATKLARFDHRQLRAAAERLRMDHLTLRHELTRDQAAELRAHLLGFEALLRAHVAREEQCLMPLLDMEPASAEARGTIV